MLVHPGAWRRRVDVLRGVIVRKVEHGLIEEQIMRARLPPNLGLRRSRPVDHGNSFGT
jgi:hypothetical protein